MQGDSGALSSSFEIEIYYEDTDLSGFVYHSNFLKYCERAREHLIGRAFLRIMLERHWHFVVSKASLRYLAPARFGDLLLVKSVGTYGRSPAMEFTHNIYQKGAENARPLVAAEVTLVLLGEMDRPIRMPDELIAHFSVFSSASNGLDLSGGMTLA